MELFSTFADDHMMRIADLLEMQNFEAGQKIFVKGSEGDRFYIIKSGVVRVTDGDTELASLTTGETFGELALMDKETSKRAATVTSVSRSILLSLSREKFEEVLGPFEHVWTVEALKNVTVWSYVTFCLVMFILTGLSHALAF